MASRYNRNIRSDLNILRIRVNVVAYIINLSCVVDR